LVASWFLQRVPTGACRQGDSAAVGKGVPLHEVLAKNRKPRRPLRSRCGDRSLALAPPLVSRFCCKALASSG